MGNKTARERALSRLKKEDRDERLRQKAQTIAARSGGTEEEILVKTDALVRGTEPRGPLETSVAKAFGDIIRQIREATQEQRNSDGSLLRPAHNSAVDIRLAFHSLDLQQEGFIFKKEQKQNSIELELATRILPAE